MNPTDEQKHAKRMMYLFLGICILCFIAMVTAITMHTLRWAFAAVLIGGWASRYYASWRNKYLND
ncbi:MAG: hypothetical protein IJD32_04990 [Bacteroidaceae bacterium]|nr:hypothetical protein [Bacteroidaceae bacterium]MBQ4056443.1 hypothetical protein [Bacteroidaceae bacterium]